MDTGRYHAKTQNELLINNFREFFKNKGYIEEPEAKITSRVDKSVFFVGSTISVLKPYFLNNNIPESGLFLIQRAIRTRVLKNLYNNNVESEWSSFFMAIGALCKYKNLKYIVRDVFYFFVDVLKIPSANIKVRISSKDDDLLKACRMYCGGIQLEIDTMSPEYYKHRYGLSEYGIYGRNFNIAILDKSVASFKDIANIIVIEDRSKKYGVEFATGLSAILARLNGIDHTIKSSVIADSIEIKSNFECKLADCFCVVASLLHEGIKPNSSNIHGRILKKYLLGLFHYADILQYSSSDIINVANKFIRDEYGIFENIGDKIINYYEKLRAKS